MVRDAADRVQSKDSSSETGSGSGTASVFSAPPQGTMVANIRPLSPSMADEPQLPASTAQTMQKKKPKVKKEPLPPPPPPRQTTSTSASTSGPIHSKKPLVTRVFSPLKFQAAPEQIGQGRDRTGDSVPARGKYHTKRSKPKRAQETFVTEQSTTPGQGDKQMHFFHHHLLLLDRPLRHLLPHQAPAIQKSL